MFEPPPGEVRPAPPFAIRTDGVGPYLLGADLKDVLDLVPRGPRIELLTIDGVAEYNLVRTEGSALLVGGARSERSRVEFVAVVRPDIAKTSTGVGVGDPIDAVDRALGPRRTTPYRVADPRLRTYAALPAVRFVGDRAEGGRVIAVVVAQSDGPTATPPRGDIDAAPGGAHAPDCRTGGALAGTLDAVVDAAKVGDAPRIVFGCFSGTHPEAFVLGAERFAIVAGTPGKLRRVASGTVPARGYVAPIDVGADGRDELASIDIDVTPEALSTAVTVRRIDGGRLVPIASATPYRITAQAAAMTGARLDEIDVLVELTAQRGQIAVGGLYMHRVGGVPKEVAPLMPAALKPRRPAGRDGARAPVDSSATGAGATDASVPGGASDGRAAP